MFPSKCLLKGSKKRLIQKILEMSGKLWTLVSEWSIIFNTQYEIGGLEPLSKLGVANVHAMAHQICVHRRQRTTAGFPAQFLLPEDEQAGWGGRFKFIFSKQLIPASVAYEDALGLIAVYFNCNCLWKYLSGSVESQWLLLQTKHTSLYQSLLSWIANLQGIEWWSCCYFLTARIVLLSLHIMTSRGVAVLVCCSKHSKQPCSTLKGSTFPFWHNLLHAKLTGSTSGGGNRASAYPQISSLSPYYPPILGPLWKLKKNSSHA